MNSPFHYGQELFDHAEAFSEAFYFWILSQPTHHKIHAKTKRILSTLMRLGDVSKQGGGFITEKEEALAVEKLLFLKQEFQEGHIKHGDLPQELELLLQNLTSANAKAKLVAKTTEIEYLFCIQPIQKYSSEMRDTFHKIIQQIHAGITPCFPDYKAQALAQGLSQIIQNPHRVEDPVMCLSLAIEGWL